MEFEYSQIGSDILSIGFAGYYDVNPRFDWNILKRYSTDILLIRDVKMAWYLRGIEGFSGDVRETVTFIRRYTHKYRKIMFIGSSMGGYAALLYGYLVGHINTTINAFGPQTDISPGTPNMKQWTVDAVKKNVYPFIKDIDKRYLSLSGMRFPNNTFIHYGDRHEYDTSNADLIDCHKRTYDSDSHSIAVWMHENRLLVPYLNSLYN